MNTELVRRPGNYGRSKGIANLRYFSQFYFQPCQPHQSIFEWERRFCKFNLQVFWLGIELERHIGLVLVGDLKLEEVAAVNACSHKQLLFLVKVALVDETGPHLNGINVNEIFVEEMKFEIRAYH